MVQPRRSQSPGLVASLRAEEVAERKIKREKKREREGKRESMCMYIRIPEYGYSTIYSAQGEVKPKCTE